MSVAQQTLQPHGRIAIRNRVKEILRASTALGEKWFCSRPSEIWLEECPCGLIYFMEEAIEPSDTTPRYYDRRLQLNVEMLQYEETERENSIDDYLDSRCYEVEAALSVDKLLGLKGLVSDVRLVNTVPVAIPEQGGDKVIAGVRLLWEIDYTMPDYPFNIAVAEFLRYTNKIDTVYPGGSIEESTQIRSE